MIDQVKELPEDGLKSSPEMSRYIENKWISRNSNKLCFLHLIDCTDGTIIADEECCLLYFLLVKTTDTLVKFLKHYGFKCFSLSKITGDK